MSSLCLTAQTKDTKKADKQFAQFEFVKAAESYNKLIEKGKGDTYVYGQLAECYYNVFNTIEAERWYAKALESSSILKRFISIPKCLKLTENMMHLMSKWKSLPL